MRQFLKIHFPFILLCSILVLILSTSAMAGSFAPLNPAFIQYQEEKVFKPSGIVSHPGGRIPSPLDLSHLKGVSLSAEIPDYPASYDLRELGFVSPIRNQNPYGSCWTFGTLASLESTTRKLMGKDLDLSERYMMYFAYIDELDLPGFGNFTSADFPYTADFGGDDYRATALLSRWTGAVLEEDAPYYGDPECIPTGFEKDVIHLQQVLYLAMDPSTRYPKPDMDNIKYALTKYGAVAVGVWANDAMGGEWDTSDYYNPVTYSAYIPEGNPDSLDVGSANHEVSIVGWDDSFASTDFATQPPGDGAWIVRNSWGTNWGDEGYYYLSYYDAALDTGAAYIGEPADNYRNIYQYDPLGWVNSTSVPDQQDNTAWFANVFTSQQTEVLKAVSFYAGGVNNTYEIYIYDSIGGKLVYGPQAGLINEPGYHTISLDVPILFEKGNDLAIVVKLTTPGYLYPVAVEYAISGYSDKTSALPGQSYVSADGINWMDTTDINASANVCLKAFTGPLTLDISGLNNIENSDLTGTCSGDMAMENAREDLADVDPAMFGLPLSDDERLALSMIDYRILSGDLEAEQSSIAIESSVIPSAGETGKGKRILLLAFNYETGRFDILSVTGSDTSYPKSSSPSISITDGGPYEDPRVEDGSLSNVEIMEVLAEASPVPPSVGGGGGGCNVSNIPLSIVLLMIPMLILLRQ